MNPRVKSVEAKQDYRLLLTFTNGEQRVFDVSPFLDKGVFKKLKSAHEFNSVHVAHGSIIWAGGQDLCPDTLYESSSPVQKS